MWGNSISSLHIITQSVQTNQRRETPTYFFLALIALTCLIEYALVVEQLIVALDDLEAGISTFTCRLFTYFAYGNKIMQVGPVSCNKECNSYRCKNNS